MSAIQCHVYRDDGTRDHQGHGRCRDCGTPAGNKRHVLPDTSEDMDEHRRRVGEGDE